MGKQNKKDIRAAWPDLLFSSSLSSWSWPRSLTAAPLTRGENIPTDVLFRLLNSLQTQTVTAPPSPSLTVRLAWWLVDSRPHGPGLLLRLPRQSVSGQDGLCQSRRALLLIRGMPALF